jgi:hypothetical protein
MPIGYWRGTGRALKQLTDYVCTKKKKNLQLLSQQNSDVVLALCSDYFELLKSGEGVAVERGNR